jgi:hypothetical protein
MGSEEHGRSGSEFPFEAKMNPASDARPTNNESIYASIRGPAIRSRIELIVGIATVR